MTVRIVNPHQVREDDDCGCAWLYEQRVVDPELGCIEVNGPWFKRMVKRCAGHRSRSFEAEEIAKPPPVTA